MTSRDLFKASLVGILAVAISAIPFESLLAPVLGIPLDEVGEGLPTPYLVPLFLIYVAIALVLARMKENLYVGRRAAFVIVFAFHYFIVAFLPELEGRIYLPAFQFLPALISASILALAVVGLIFYLWKQEDHPEADFGQQLSAYFASRTVIGWIWRFFLVWLMFYVLTMAFGIVAYPFNKPYLDDALNALGMVVPSTGTLFAITQFRSLIYLFVTLPFVIFWRSSRRDLFLLLTASYVIQYPLLGDGVGAFYWPAMYRAIDFIVLALQLTAVSWLYVTLLWKGEKSEA
ncbi:MAG: hypothetical protein ACK2UL_10355 [Anaerolineae bacterium]